MTEKINWLERCKSSESFCNHWSCNLQIILILSTSVLTSYFRCWSSVSGVVITITLHAKVAIKCNFLDSSWHCSWSAVFHSAVFRCTCLSSASFLCLWEWGWHVDDNWEIGSEVGLQWRRGSAGRQRRKSRLCDLRKKWKRERRVRSKK